MKKIKNLVNYQIALKHIIQKKLNPNNSRNLWRNKRGTTIYLPELHQNHNPYKNHRDK
jgi:hypothetical protein